MSCSANSDRPRKIESCIQAANTVLTQFDRAPISVLKVFWRYVQFHLRAGCVVGTYIYIYIYIYTKRQLRVWLEYSKPGVPGPRWT